MSTRGKKPLVFSCRICCLRSSRNWGKIELSALSSFMSFCRHLGRVRGPGLDPVVGLHRVRCISAQEMYQQSLWSVTTQNRASALVVSARSLRLLTIWCYSELVDGRDMNPVVDLRRVGCSWAQEFLFLLVMKCHNSKPTIGFGCIDTFMTIDDISMCFWAWWWSWLEFLHNIRSYDVRLWPDSPLDVVERFDRLKLVPESAVIRQLLKPYELIETTSPNHSGIPEMVRVVVIPAHDDTRELI